MPSRCSTWSRPPDNQQRQGPPPVLCRPEPRPRRRARRIRIFSRGDVSPQFQWKQDPLTNRWILVWEQGATIIIDGLNVPSGSIPGVPRGPTRLDISTDRFVLWSTLRSQPDISGQTPQDGNEPMELYLEGNVVFLQGNRQIFADRMYYDVRNHVGTVLAADMITPAPGYEGKIHIHADVLQEDGPDHFRGQDGYITPSRLGVPRISLHSSDFTYDEIPAETDPFTGAPLIDPRTGQPEDQKLVSGQNDTVYVESVPVFWWPTFSTDLNDASFFVRGVRFKDDSVFGTQLYFDFSAYQLFGVNRPPKGTDWTFSIDYLSLRGWAEGTTYTYNRGDFLGIPGQVNGLWNFWGIDDHGRDNLGQGRTSVAPEPDVNYRYELIGRHRQDLGDGWTITGEVGKISDRNFLLEYFKPDWDTQKDPTTDVHLKLRREDSSLELFAQDRLDNFVTETNWLPRADYFLLGQSLLGDHLTWFSHTSAGYAQFQVATLPSAAAGDEATSHLPWEPQNFSGGRFVTRNELDLPLELGPVKVVPYVLGEIGYWGQDLSGQDLTREYYQAGVRATLPMWAADSDVESSLWNVHGLAAQGRVPGRVPARAVQRPGDGLAALRSAGRPADRGLPPPLCGQHVRPAGRSAAGNARSAGTVRRAALCPPHRLGGHGHVAKHGNRRRPGRASPGPPPAPGRRSAAPPKTPTSSTGSSSTPTSQSSPTPHATTSARWPVSWTTTSSGTWATG